MNYGQANKIMRDMSLKQPPPNEYQNGSLLGGQTISNYVQKKTQEISATQRSIETLDKNVSILSEVLASMSQRLSVATRPETACENKQEGLSTICSPLVDRINGIDRRIQQLTHSMQMQLELLEI